MSLANYIARFRMAGRAMTLSQLYAILKLTPGDVSPGALSKIAKYLKVPISDLTAALLEPEAALPRPVLATAPLPKPEVELARAAIQPEVAPLSLTKPVFEPAPLPEPEPEPEEYVAIEIETETPAEAPEPAPEQIETEAVTEPEIPTKKKRSRSRPKKR